MQAYPGGNTKRGKWVQICPETLYIKKTLTRKMLSPKYDQKAFKMIVFFPWRPEFRHNFQQYLQYTSKDAQKHHFKDSKIQSLKMFLTSLQKWHKLGQKWPFFYSGGPNFAKVRKACILFYFLCLRGYSLKSILDKYLMVLEIQR